MDEFYPPKPRSVLMRIRHTVAFLIEVTATVVAIPVALFAHVGAAIGGLSTFREVAQDAVEMFSEAKSYLKLLYMEYIA